MVKVCTSCGSQEVYEIEFRTDYSSPRNLYPVNPNIKDLDEDDIPYYLGGHYCHRCQSLCNIQDAKKHTVVDVDVVIDINERWEKGIPHDERSKEIFEFIKEYDFHFANDFFCFKSGGDGDNGEHLMYLLDEYFANKDKQQQN